MVGKGLKGTNAIEEGYPSNLALHQFLSIESMRMAIATCQRNRFIFSSSFLSFHTYEHEARYDRFSASKLGGRSPQGNQTWFMEQFEVGGTILWQLFVCFSSLTLISRLRSSWYRNSDTGTLHFDDRDPPCKNVIGAYCSIFLHLGIIVTFPLCNTASHKYAH